MKKLIVVITSTILLTGLPSPSLAQMPMQSSHQPTSSAVVPVAAPAPSKSPLTPIARVNGVVLTEDKLDEEMQRLFPYYAIHGGRVPPTAEAELREKALHDMVLHELVYQEARSRKLDVPALTWQKRLRQMRQAFPSRQAFEAAAIKKYGSVLDFERRLRRAMLVEQLWSSEVGRKSVVTAAAARAYYQGHKAQFVRPEAVWLQTITIKFPNNATKEQKQEARKLTEQVLVKAKAAKNYEEFGELAEQLSQDEWRVMMGDHKWVHRGAVAPEIEQAVFGLKAGETSGVVESSTGYLILRANDYQLKRQMTYAEMAGSIRQRMEKDKGEMRSKEFEELLRTKAKIEML